MTLREEAMKELENVPEYKLDALIQFMRFLESSKITVGVPERKPKGKPIDILGIWKDKAVIPDEILKEKFELVSPEELEILEEMRAKKKAEFALQEVAV